MTPRKIAEHAYEGSLAAVQSRRGRRPGFVKISHCSEDGVTLYCWFTDEAAAAKARPVPVPFSRVEEIRHGAASTAPDYIKKANPGAVR